MAREERERQEKKSKQPHSRRRGQSSRHSHSELADVLSLTHTGTKLLLKEEQLKFVQCKTLPLRTRFVLLQTFFDFLELFLSLEVND